MVQERKTNTRWLIQYDSLAELGRWIDNTFHTWPSARLAENTNSKHTWTLGASYKGAVRMARNGWIEGAQRAQEALRAFPPLDNGATTVNDFYGHIPHVPRFCAGAPDSMIRYAHQAKNGSGRVLTLYVALTMHFGTKAEYVANFGLAVAQYINQLENEGRRVELYGVMPCDFEFRAAATVCLKRAEQPLDLAVTAFAIGHPAMFRRLGFAIWERSPMRQNMSYGTPGDATLSDLIDPPAGAIILNGMARSNDHARTPQSALEYVTKMIDQAIEQQGKE